MSVKRYITIEKPTYLSYSFVNVIVWNVMPTPELLDKDCTVYSCGHAHL